MNGRFVPSVVTSSMSAVARNDARAEYEARKVGAVGEAGEQMAMGQKPGSCQPTKPVIEYHKARVRWILHQNRRLKLPAPNLLAAAKFR